MTIGDVEVVRRDQDVFAVAFEQRAPPERPDGVRHERSEGIPGHSGGDRAPIGPGCAGQRLGHAARDRESRQGKDELARYRDRGALDRHGEDHAQVAEGRIGAFQQGQDVRVDRFEHVVIIGLEEPGRVRKKK